MKKFIFSFVVILCVSSCGGGGGGGGGTRTDPAPGAVTMTHASISSTSITLDWIDPADPNLDSIVITYRRLSPSTSDFAFLVPDHALSTLENRSNSWTGAPTVSVPVDAGSRYEIIIATYDTDNNEKTVSFKITAAATSRDYYFIYTAADLNALRGSVAGYEEWDTEAEGFVLMDDISLSAFSSGEGWVPIGSNTGSFGKTFEGNGHTISGLSINRPADDYQGLFGYLGGPGIINDLTVQGSVGGQSHVGGLVGTSEGTISNCVSGVAVTGNITGEFQDIGGLVGDNAGSVSGSSATGTVSGIYRVGGLIGYNDGGTVAGCSATGAVTTTFDFAGGLVGCNNVGTISDSYASGAVMSTNNNAGGLVGANMSGSITNCYATGTVSSPDSAGGLAGYNNGNISSSHATGNVTGESYTGGLIGNMEGGTVTTCYATGTVSGTDIYIGGLVGYCDGGTITNSYARGSVTANATTADDYAGGLVGCTVDGSITNCYSTGAVVGNGNFRGGLVGDANVGPVNCFYDTETTGLGDTNGTPTSTTNMKLQGTFTDWTFPGTWSIGTLNNGYPYLTNNAPAE